MKIMMMISLIMRIIMMIMKTAMTMRIMMMTTTRMMKIMTMKNMMMTKTKMITEGVEAQEDEEVPELVISRETAREDLLPAVEEALDPVLVQDQAHQEEEDLLQVQETELQEEVLHP